VDDLILYRKSETDYYSIADPNWNVAALTNASGVVQERYTYAAFGKVNFFDAAFATRATSSCNVTRMFTGQVLDTETGFMLYRNRVYHTILGRFVQRDPIGYIGNDVNFYRYLNNIPQSFIDPFGTKKCQIPPVTNGCGPDGPIGSFIPDSYFLFDFTEACNSHDICYGTCGKSQWECDLQFLFDLLSECEASNHRWNPLWPSIQDKCVLLALAYAGAVMALGKGPYEDAQDKYCIEIPDDKECCDDYTEDGDYISPFL